MVELAASSVFLFIGDDEHSKRKAVLELKRSLVGSSGDSPDYKIFYGRDADSKTILEHITTVPFLASRRLAVVKDFNHLPKEDRSRLLEYIKKPIGSSCLVIEDRDDSILRSDPGIAGLVSVRSFTAPFGSKRSAWLKSYLKDNGGKSIDDDALELFCELQTGDMDGAANELEKLTAFTGTRGRITISDVEEIVGKHIMRGAFDIADAAGMDDADQALRIAKDLMAMGKKPYEILGVLAWHYKRLSRAALLKRAGRTDSSIADLLRIGYRYRSLFFKQAGASRLKDLKAHLGTLLQADIEIKTSAQTPALALELAILKLCLRYP